MKKIIAIITLAILVAGCNRQIIDLKYKFNTAYLKMPDGTAKTIEVKKWRDYENSDMIQIIDKDDVVYLTHSVNVILVYKENR